MNKILLGLCAASAVIAAVPADAQGRRDRGYYGHPAYTQYDRHHREYRERRLARNDRVWRGNDGRYHCRRNDGTTGLIVGGAAGALLGNQVAGRGDHTLGTIIGGIGGALIGQQVDRGDMRCR